MKRFFGENFDQFIRVKAQWLWNHLFGGAEKKPDQTYQLLDYGCGTGEMLRWLKLFGFPGGLHGADVSKAMLDEAEKRWGDSSKPGFSCIGETTTNFAANTFHCVVATCVFHHIEPEKRGAVLKEIKRILVPGGIVVVFEHNPFNPLTRLIVKRAVIDRNAVLLYPSEMRDRYRSESLKTRALEYLMFFPPGMQALQQFERYLGWCPLGAQYAAVGEKGS